VPAQINSRSAKLLTFAPATTKWSSVLISTNANAASLDAQWRAAGL
jgi:hypothetical protein